MVKNRVSIHYAGFSRLQADINAMQELLEASPSWNHLINLCGRDFPIKTNDQIENYLKEKLETLWILYPACSDLIKNLGNRSDIGSVAINPGDKKYERVSRSQVHAADISEEEKKKFHKLGYRTKTLTWSGHWLRAKGATHMETYERFYLVFIVRKLTNSNQESHLEIPLYIQAWHTIFTLEAFLSLQSIHKYRKSFYCGVVKHIPPMSTSGQL